MSTRDIVRRLWNPFRAIFRRTPLLSLHPFDRKFKVDTGGLAYADSLESGHENDRYSSGYYATAPSLFHGAISLWQRSLTSRPYSLSDYAFLDAGCGKGRALMIASEYPFRELVGVELNPGLAAVADCNLAKWTRSAHIHVRIRVETGDILKAAFPPGPVLLYLFNSFEAEIVHLLLDRLQTISATRSEPIDLIYIHPDYGPMVRQAPRMELLADAEIAFSEVDAAADVFGVAHDRCSIFCLPGMQTVSAVTSLKPDC